MCRNGRRDSSCLATGIRSGMVTVFWRQVPMTGGGWHWWQSRAHNCWDWGLVGFICTTTVKDSRLRVSLGGRQRALVHVRPWVWCEKKKTKRFSWCKTGFKTSTWMFLASLWEQVMTETLVCCQPCLERSQEGSYASRELASESCAFSPAGHPSRLRFSFGKHGVCWTL